jgi:hypothetical protein
MIFIAQEQTYPEIFNALVDSCSSVDSGVTNFFAVAYGFI